MIGYEILKNAPHYRYENDIHYYLKDNVDYYYYSNGKWVLLKIQARILKLEQPQKQLQQTIQF